MFSGIAFTLYFDGSQNTEAQKAGAGCIITDDSGEVVVAAAYNLVGSDLSWCDEAAAEMIGLRNGLRLAKDRNVTLSAIKGDNPEVIDLVRGQPWTQPQSRLTAIIAEIKRNLGFASVQRIDRAANKVAVKLASMGSLLVTGNRIFTKYDVPPQIVELINEDRLRNGEEDNRLPAIRNVRHIVEPRDGGEDNLLANGILAVGLVAAGAAALWGAFNQAPNIMGFLNNNNNNNNAHYTLQYFGSDRNQVQKARAGCIIRNGRQFVVAAAYNLDNKYPGCNVALAEAIALKNGLKLARDNSVQLDVINGRNREVRDRVLGLERRTPRFHELSAVIEEIKYVLHYQGIQPEDLNLNHVNEETIKVARELATVGGSLRQEAVVYNRVGDLPPRVASLFNADIA